MQRNQLLQSIDPKKKLVVFAGGGTAGHVNPALAIANALAKEEPSVQILFCGNDRGVEKNLVERSGFLFYPISAEPFEYNRPKMFLRAIRAFYQGKKQCKELLKKYDVLAVVGTGGYVCAPLLAAAKELKIPRVLHEQNAYPGKAITTMSKDADCVCVSFPNTLDQFPKAKKTLWTGNPVDSKFFQYDKAQMRQALSIPSHRRYVLVSGGSLGALSINEAVADLVELEAKQKSSTPFFIHLVTGKKYYQEYKERLKAYSSQVKVSDYIYNMPEEMAACDLVIARAGAGTCFELAALAKASILVPYPFAKADHQRKNAQALVDNGGAVLVLDQEISAALLKQRIEEVFINPERLHAMERNAHLLAKEDAALLVVKEILALESK